MRTAGILPLRQAQGQDDGVNDQRQKQILCGMTSVASSSKQQVLRLRVAMRRRRFAQDDNFVEVRAKDEKQVLRLRWRKVRGNFAQDDNFVGW